MKHILGPRGGDSTVALERVEKLNGLSGLERAGEGCYELKWTGLVQKWVNKRPILMLVCPRDHFRPALLNLQPVLDGGLLHPLLPLQQLEAGQEARTHPPHLVFHLHDVRISLRAQRLRRVQPAGMRQHLLNH